MNAITPDRLRAEEQRISAPLLQDSVPSGFSFDRAVSWRAIAAGAAGAAALSLILLVLGMGLGLSAVSPWAQAGVAATSFGIATILWITLTQLAASGLGGYLAGRLRHRRSLNTADDEVFFRDTAHGFLAWAVATLATAALLTSAIGNVLGVGAQAGAALVGSGAATATVLAGKTEESSPASQYFVDALFRPAAAIPAADAASAPPPGSNAGNTATAPLPEVLRVFAHNGRNATLPAEDVRYVGQLVAQHTGMPQAEAEKRVSDSYARLQAQLSATEAQTKQAADQARKASAYGSLWLFVSLLGGAFVASLAATLGGRQRDL